MVTITSDSAEATFALGREFAAELPPGSVLALEGDLGAGKTQFVKGLAAGLGCDAEVTSPTFTIVHEYPGGRLPLIHLDLYRLESESELLSLGFDEYLAVPGVIALEWADKFARLLPSGVRRIRIALRDGDEREIQIS